MEVGATIRFPFGKQEREGVVYKVFPKTIYILTDFDNHQRKIIRRKVSDLKKEKGTKKSKA